MFTQNICLVHAVSVIVHFPSQHALRIEVSQLAYLIIRSQKHFHIIRNNFISILREWGVLFQIGMIEFAIDC